MLRLNLKQLCNSRFYTSMRNISTVTVITYIEVEFMRGPMVVRYCMLTGNVQAMEVGTQQPEMVAVKFILKLSHHKSVKLFL